MRYKYGSVRQFLTPLIQFMNLCDITSGRITFFPFFVSVLASVVAYYICKWLDGDE